MDKMTESRAAEAQAQGDRLAIKMLVAAGYVTEAKANEALNIAHGFDKGPLAPPSAPVGVERLVAELRGLANHPDSLEWRHSLQRTIVALEAALAQQPAAVDGANREAQE